LIVDWFSGSFVHWFECSFLYENFIQNFWNGDKEIFFKMKFPNAIHSLFQQTRPKPLMADGFGN